MGFPFRKKEDASKFENAPRPPIECSHLWKDFPWYAEGEYNDDTGNLYLQITEPYVCVRCKKRKDVKLYDWHGYFKTKEEADKKFRRIQEQYTDYLKDRPIIEDMINDYQLVDREALAIFDYIRGSRTANSKIILSLEKEDGSKVEKTL